MIRRSNWQWPKRCFVRWEPRTAKAMIYSKTTWKLPVAPRRGAKIPASRKHMRKNESLSTTFPSLLMNPILNLPESLTQTWKEGVNHRRPWRLTSATTSKRYVEVSETPHIDGRLPTAYLLSGRLFVRLPATQVMPLTLKIRPLLWLPLAHEPVRRLCENDVLLYLVTDLVTPVRQSSKLPEPMRTEPVQKAIALIDVVRRLTLSETPYVDADVQGTE